MDLNLYLIKDNLKKYLDCKICFEHIEEDRLHCALETAVFFSDSDTDPCRLYLLDRDAWSRHGMAPGISYIIWDWDDSCPTPQGCSYLGLTGSFSGMGVLNAVQELFLFYQKWESGLYALTARDAALKELGDSSLKCFTNPICLYTANFQNIFYSERRKSANMMFFHPEDLYSFISYDDVEQLRFDQDFARSIDQTVPSVFPDEFFGYRILYDNIRKNGIFIARLMLCEVERPFNDSDYILLRRLAEIMGYSIERQNWRINGHPQHMDEYIRLLLGGGYVADRSLAPVFREMGWDLQDEFFCGLIPLNRENRTYTNATLCSKLESSVRGTLAIMHDETIFLLSNISQSGSNRDRILAAMIYIIREYVLHAGFSMPFSGIDGLQHYYGQARYALQCGEKTDPTLWYYRYEHYEYHHLLENALGSASLESLYPIGLKRLLDYDKKHGREYTRALQVYLEQNMSVTATIRELYIQKSTFIYQLKRIREISGIDLENREIRILYLLIFQIMKEKGRL